jgi:lipopolysaccharide export system permease protein
MKIIDKYLIKQFLQTIFFGLIAFTLLFVVIDMMENLDDFIDQSVPFGIILHYYLVFSPDIIKLMTPVSVLFGALFTVGKVSNLSELTAIKASGISMYRFMAPFVITTLLISMLSIYFSGFVVPMANKTKLNIQLNYLKKGFVYTGDKIFFQDSPTRIVNIAFFDNNENQANRVGIQEFEKDDLTHMTSRIDAAKMIYDSLSHSWIAYNGVKRTFNQREESADYFSQLNLNYLRFKPSDLLTKQQKPEEMNLSELGESIKSQEKAGLNATNTLIEYYSRFSFPMASLVVVLFGLPISANKRRGGLAVQVGINILITFIYLVFMQISLAFGKNGVLNPMLTAWFADLVFLAGAFVNLPRVRQ